MWKNVLPAIAIVNSFFKDSPGDFRIPFRWDCSITEPLFSPREARRVQFVFSLACEVHTVGSCLVKVQVKTALHFIFHSPRELRTE